MSLLPIAKPDFSGRESDYVRDCIESGWITHHSPYVGKFEQALGDWFGRPTIACANGTAAIYVALKTLGIGYGDEVITASLTFAGTAEAIVMTGATPIFVDVDPNSWCIDPAKVGIHVSGRTKAIVPVHLYGTRANMEALSAFGVPLVEDSAEAFDVMPSGTMACFSFFGNKVITTGEGGAIVTHPGMSYVNVSRFISHCHLADYRHTDVGFNFRMTGLQAAVGYAQMQRLGTFLEKRRAVEKRYHSKLSALKGRGSWLYTCLVKDRDHTRRMLNLKGYETRHAFYPLHLQEPYRQAGSLPVSEYIGKHGVSLPTGTHVTDDDVDRISEIVLKCEV